MEITLIGPTGPCAADRAAAASKRGRVNVLTPVPATAAESARRLGRKSRKFIAIHSPVQVYVKNCCKKLLLTREQENSSFFW